MNRFDLIKTDSTIYRVLAIKEKILVIDCIRRKMPFWVEKLSGTPTTEQDLQLETGIKPPDIDDLSPNARKIAYVVLFEVGEEGFNGCNLPLNGLWFVGQM